MVDVICKLIACTYNKDSIGNEILTEAVNEIPIIRVEDVYASEFYQAAQQGLRPNLRLRISSLNYNNELELEYMGTRYTIIRSQMEGDETILVCERKVKNAN